MIAAQSVACGHSPRRGIANNAESAGTRAPNAAPVSTVLIARQMTRGQAQALQNGIHQPAASQWAMLFEQPAAEGMDAAPDRDRASSPATPAVVAAAPPAVATAPDNATAPAPAAQVAQQSPAPHPDGLAAGYAARDRPCYFVQPVLHELPFQMMASAC